MNGPYQPRLVDSLLSELVPEVPAVSLIGPRASGKTTTAARHAASVGGERITAVPISTLWA